MSEKLDSSSKVRFDCYWNLDRSVFFFSKLFEMGYGEFDLNVSHDICWNLFC